MKIAIPTDGKKGVEDSIAEHFGRCFTYTFLSEKGEVLEIVDNTSENKDSRDLPPELIKKRGADILLCRDIGPKALILSEKLGIEVYIGQAKTVKEIFALWKNKKIKKADIKNACEQNKI